MRGGVMKVTLFGAREKTLKGEKPQESYVLDLV
jgi:hypothetical protein